MVGLPKRVIILDKLIKNPTPKIRVMNSPKSLTMGCTADLQFQHEWKLIKKKENDPVTSTVHQSYACADKIRIFGNVGYAKKNMRIMQAIYGSRATNTNTNTEFSFPSERKGLFGSCS